MTGSEISLGSSLENRAMIITGGGSGIGAATARLAAQLGVLPIIVDLNIDAAREVARPIGALALQADVSKESDVARVFGEARRQVGPIHLLFNNAGIGPSVLDAEGVRGIAETSYAWILRTIEVNLVSVALMSKHFLQGAAERSAIINNASVNALVGTPNSDAYTASKGGVVAITRSMAVDWGPKGVRINCVCPGSVSTPMVAGRHSDRRRLADLERSIPLRRVAEPDEVAWVVLFLASDLASYVNGAVIPIDGGLSAS